MPKRDAVLDAILRGTADANIDFTQLCRLLERLGFAQRVKGRHHIFTKDGVDEILNLQPKGAKAKSYQVEQVRSIIVRYKLAEEADGSD